MPDPDGAGPDGVERLAWSPAGPRLELTADPVAAQLAAWSVLDRVQVAPIDAELADTAAFCQRYGVPMAEATKRVLVAGTQAGELRYAACVVLATDRADVNGALRRVLDVRKASFAAMVAAVALTGMEYGGITPIGLPAGWPIFIAGQVADAGPVVIGSGLRRSKLRIDGRLLAELPGAQVLAELALSPAAG
ncbi:MAG: YbaK/EbsC family protein [Jatrophihabitans sp.]